MMPLVVVSLVLTESPWWRQIKRVVANSLMDDLLVVSPKWA